MSIDFKTAGIFVLPLLGIAVAWGQSMERIEALENNQALLVTKAQLETLEVKVSYIKEQTIKNEELLQSIWRKVNE